MYAVGKIFLIENLKIRGLVRYLEREREREREMSLFPVFLFSGLNYTDYK